MLNQSNKSIWKMDQNDNKQTPFFPHFPWTTQFHPKSNDLFVYTPDSVKVTLKILSRPWHECSSWPLMSYYRIHKQMKSHATKCPSGTVFFITKWRVWKANLCVFVWEKKRKRKMLNAQNAAFKPPHAKLMELTFSFWVSHLTDGITRLLLEMKSRSVLTA